jgi:hypothetical protein
MELCLLIEAAQERKKGDASAEGHGATNEPPPQVSKVAQHRRDARASAILTERNSRLKRYPFVRMGVDIAGSPDAFQAEEEGSIPFTALTADSMT